MRARQGGGRKHVSVHTRMRVGAVRWAQSVCAWASKCWGVDAGLHRRVSVHKQKPAGKDKLGK